MRIKRIVKNSGSTLVESIVSMAIIGVCAAMISAGVVAGTNFLMRGMDNENDMIQHRVNIERAISDWTASKSVNIESVNMTSSVVKINGVEKDFIKLYEDGRVPLEYYYVKTD